MALVTLRNNTSIPQNIVFHGKQIILGSNEEMDFIEVVAEKFIELRSPLVSVVEEDVGGVYEDSQKDIIWVANMTGNPDAPDVIKAKLFVNRQWQMVDADNPKKKARPLTMFFDQGMRSYTAKDGALEALNLAKKEIKIPPYKRRALPSNEAKWWLNRDSVCEAHYRGCSIKSREPTDFEPSPGNIDEWALDNLRAYLKLMDPGAEMGRSQATVTSEAKKRGHRKDAEISAHVEEEKHLLMKRIYFRLVDPQYPVPSKSEFLEFVHGQKEVAPVEEDAAASMIEKSTQEVKRKRGRPRKNPPEAPASA
tara:strand:+ start:1102 stop:2025 length:924 start_codon:yes stop_codon:yes gene_type:complete